MTVMAADYAVVRKTPLSYPGIEQLVVSRHDEQPIENLDDVAQLQHVHAPRGLLLAVHLWLHRDTPNTNGDQPVADHLATSAAASNPPAARTAPTRVPPRSPRRGGTLNLREREITALEEYIAEPFALDDGSGRAELVLAVKEKLARLPHHTAVVA